ncbi:glycine amidinotransferase [Bradyrhizobium huanghuaihaiense]|uniref:Glycine amidinotransferase n=2 Tax=Bradyrhizobium TaxID=374 RepID=A0A562QKJ0_9BRAD|nr:glycine amidinotransferase [Bradyrhizobium huanghuaihaiense]
MLRSRYFETQFLKPIFASYFDRGARWSVMPRPLMTNRSFDRSYALSTTGGPTEPIHHPGTHPYDVGLEMMWDGAQCLRVGRDLVVNIATKNHAMPCDWLERHLQGRFRIHRAYKLCDSHIDSMVIALAPGPLLVRSREVADYLPEAMRNWDMIVAPEPTKNSFPAYNDDDLLLSSLYIDVNVLSVAPDVVLVNDACPELARILEQYSFQVVPVRRRHRRIFGGGFVPLRYSRHGSRRRAGGLLQLVPTIVCFPGNDLLSRCFGSLIPGEAYAASASWEKNRSVGWHCRS